ncbi:MAG: tRNA pseudouridine(38-40) synthase TruA [Proteobacteria bacterium]|nr:tRNA pseudouridine(38-40) synthase TruA [Pseudomonadota bacterium]MBU2228634.1 tRNA pseudouridine(38-40) synthase TruA [Pseudomonadota bacterium]MBU2262934.1 tRNA pseudouridine(38-40) synthase TruA [Pseudomonadota bacterium]
MRRRTEIFPQEDPPRSRRLPPGNRERGEQAMGFTSCRYRLTIEYDGTGYSGWQTQKNARSIQGTLIEAARDLFGADVDVQGAGRTDAGVHALAQVAHLDAPRRLPPQRLLFGLNDLLPAPINILKVEEAPAGFHARHSARGRSYLYLISRHRTAFGKRYVWWVKDDLDPGRMKASAEIFLGFHDFASFADKRIDKHLSTEVQIDRAEIIARSDMIVFRIAGSHFLWKMVRRLAGILVEAGRGNLSRTDIERLLVHASELPARCTAPPSGLYLAQVLYEGDRLAPVEIPPLPFFLR